MNDVINHYDKLIDENNDPARDPKDIRDYMDKWDGEDFLDELKLDKTKTVLEIGVGTGRLALKVIKSCKDFTGIDISYKTIKRAEENLMKYNNKAIFCADFLEFNFEKKFDIIYCSLTLWHIKEKEKFFEKVSNLLNNGGRFVLSIGNNQSKEFDFGTRIITMFPDNIHDTINYLEKLNLEIITKKTIEFATIITAIKTF